jgi:hypothetical protein
VPADALSAEAMKKEPDSCDGDGPLLQVSSHRRCAYRSYRLPQAEPRAR